MSERAPVNAKYAKMCRFSVAQREARKRVMPGMERIAMKRARFGPAR